MSRKPKIEPQCDYHLTSAFRDDDIIGLILKGHLVIEAMIAKILNKSDFGEEIWSWPFPKKIKKALKVSPLPDWVADICLDINNIRNDYCHSLGHQLTFDVAFDLAQKWSSLGLDYSDEVIFSVKDEAEEIYGVEGILTETISNTIDELNIVFGKLGIKETYWA